MIRQYEEPSGQEKSGADILVLKSTNGTWGSVTIPNAEEGSF